MRRVLTTTAAVLVASAASPALAAETFAVVPAGDASSPVIDAIDQAADMRVGLRAATAASGDLVRRCGSDMYCVASGLREADVQIGLVVNVNLSFPPPFFSLHLVDTRAGGVVAETSGELPGDPAAVARTIAAHAGRLLEGAGYPEGGRIAVELSGPSQARLTLSNGAIPDEGTPAAFVVPPGRYEVRAEAPSFIPATAEAVVIAGRETKVALELKEDRSLFASPWFWIGVGVLAAGGAAAAVVLTHDGGRCLCLTHPAGSCDVCLE